MRAVDLLPTLCQAFETSQKISAMGGLGRVTSIEIQAEGTYDEGILSRNLQHALDMNKTLAGKVEQVAGKNSLAQHAIVDAIGFFG
jgi:hypothetical protein